MGQACDRHEREYLLDLLLVRGLYSCDSSSMPFCLLYQSNSVRSIEGRQYSERELMELMTLGKERRRLSEGLLAGTVGPQNIGCCINNQP